jgi:uncharacterized delta-60 repeat protein
MLFCRKLSLDVQVKMHWQLIVFMVVFVLRFRVIALDSRTSDLDGEGFKVNGEVLAITVQQDDKIVFAGHGTNAQGASVITRLYPDGTEDRNAHLLVGYGGGNWVHALGSGLASDGLLLVGGYFEPMMGDSIPKPEDCCFHQFYSTPVLSYSVDAPVLAINVRSDRRIFIGGAFHTINGRRRPYLAALDQYGRFDTTTPFNSRLYSSGDGPNSGVRTVAFSPEGNVLIGGDFTSVYGTNRSRVAQIRADGSQFFDGTLDPRFVPPDINGQVWSVAAQADGKVIIAGEFTSLTSDGITHPYNRIARLNTSGSVDTDFLVGGGANGRVHAVAVETNGAILVGGSFTQFDGKPRPGIARLNTNGSLDESFIHGVEGIVVNALTTQRDGRVLIGGRASDGRGFVQRLPNDPSPSLHVAHILNEGIVISWSNRNFRLEYSTNVIGPYSLDQTSTSPWTNTDTATRRFFRLRQN